MPFRDSQLQVLTALLIKPTPAMRSRRPIAPNSETARPQVVALCFQIVENALRNLHALVIRLIRIPSALRLSVRWVTVS